MYRGQRANRGVSEDLRIGAQRPKTLVHDPLSSADRTNRAIVSSLGAEPILHDGQLDARVMAEALEVPGRVAVAEAQLTGAAGIDERFERAPDFQRLLRRRQGRMQDEAVHMIGLQVP